MLATVPHTRNFKPKASWPMRVKFFYSNRYRDNLYVFDYILQNTTDEELASWLVHDARHFSVNFIKLAKLHRQAKCTITRHDRLEAHWAAWDRTLTMALFEAAKVQEGPVSTSVANLFQDSYTKMVKLNEKLYEEELLQEHRQASEELQMLIYEALKVLP